MEMKKKDMADQGRNAGTILARIQEESAQEIARIIQSSRAEEGKIIGEAAAEAGRGKAGAADALRQELDKARERVFSGLALEKKRLLLEEKDRLIRQVLQAVTEQARQFRDGAGYAGFLRAAVAEGARVVGGDAIAVTYAPADAKSFGQGEFIRALESHCREALGRAVTFSYTQGDFNEPGVILTSVDGRIRFDNRFSCRLSRLEADIYAQLLKEAF